MDENLAGILRESNKLISKLHLLSVYFEDEVIFKIYLRTQVIHKLFETNPELDIHKLDLFHLQYTASLIELLRKIKKGNEKNAALVLQEIQLNNDLISKMQDSVYTEENFNLDKQKQALKINTSLCRLYQILSDHSKDFPFSKNITGFSSRFSKEYFYDISLELLTNLTTFNSAEVYQHPYAVIQKKLLGSLCKHDFKSEFFCGLKAGTTVIEIYRILHTAKYFLFYPAANLFLFCDPTHITDIDFTTPLSRKAKIIQEIGFKNDKLESSLALIKTALPPEIISLLTDTYKKISDISFLKNIGQYDVQANILKTMLDTDSL